MGIKVRQKVKGKGQPWWIFIHHNGRRTSRKIGNKATAEALAKKLKAQIALGQYQSEPGINNKEDEAVTFGEYAEKWITLTVPTTCKKSTGEDYSIILKNHVLPAFKDADIREISRGRLKDFLMKKLKDGYSVSTVAHMKHVMSGVFNKAVDDEVIPLNPALNLKGILKKKESARAVNPLTPEELTVFLRVIKDCFPKYYPFALFLTKTGVRIGEAVGLKWSDINFEDRQITIKRSVTRDRISEPKSGKYRTIDITLQVTEILRKHKAEADAEAQKKGWSSGFVFTNTAGNYIDQNGWRRRVFRKALEIGKLRRVRIHDLRHTYATLRISKGDNIGDVSKQLGHHSVKLTLDTYYHWVPGQKKSEVDELDNLF